MKCAERAAGVTGVDHRRVLHMKTFTIQGQGMHYIRLGVALLATYAIAACSKPAADAPPAVAGDPAIPVQVGVDTATDPTIRRLEREAVALAKVEGCTSGEQCRSAPVGSRGCGGPRYYLAYCPLTTDSAALFAKLAEVARAEDDYNRRNQVASTCEMRMPGQLDVAAGSCRFRTP
jgi:hypothetical protein